MVNTITVTFYNRIFRIMFIPYRMGPLNVSFLFHLISSTRDDHRLLLLNPAVVICRAAFTDM